MYDYDNISILLGKTLRKIVVGIEKDEIFFQDSDGQYYMMYHEQDSCESVSIEDVVGDWKDLVQGDPIILAEEVSNDDAHKKDAYCDESHTWTYYKLATIRGTVNIRWYGTSNGYYSERVDFKMINKERVSISNASTIENI